MAKMLKKTGATRSTRGPAPDEVLRRYWALWLPGAPPALRDVFAPGVVERTMPPGTDALRALETRIALFRSAFPDATHTVRLTVSEGDRITGHGTFRATHLGALGDVPATGKKVEMNTIETLRVKNGRVVELWSMPDRMELLGRIGVVPPLDAVENLVRLLTGVRRSATLRSAIELGLFAAVGDGAGADEIARRIRCPERATRFLLDALVELGLLTARGPLYQLTPTAATHLVPGRDRYFGSMAAIWCSPVHWEGYTHLTKAIRNDGTVLRRDAEHPEHPFWETFARSCAPGTLPVAALLEARLHEWLRSKPKPRILDLGAGSGIHGFVFLQRNPRARLAVLDWPNVIPEIERWAERLEVAHRDIQYIGGDCFEADYRGPHDLVLVGHVYHHFDRDRCAELTRRIANALAPGGRLVLHEFMALDDSYKGRSFNITMLAWTRQGEAYSRRDYEEWFSAAGLRMIDVLPNPGVSTRLIIAEKPARRGGARRPRAGGRARRGAARRHSD